VQGRCVQGYPQAIADPAKPRLAYWTCSAQVRSTTWCRVIFKGCGRDLCDLHCRKYTIFQKGKRNDRIV